MDAAEGGGEFAGVVVAEAARDLEDSAVGLPQRFGGGEHLAPLGIGIETRAEGLAIGRFDLCAGDMEARLQLRERDAALLALVEIVPHGGGERRVRAGGSGAFRNHDAPLSASQNGSDFLVSFR